MSFTTQLLQRCGAVISHWPLHKGRRVTGRNRCWNVESCEIRQLLAGVVLRVAEVEGTIVETISSNGRLYFETIGSKIDPATNQSVGYARLFTSDGTAGNASLVREFTRNLGVVDDSYQLFHLTDVNGTVFFVANDGVHGKELWKTDGSTIGTTMVIDIAAGILGGGGVDSIINA